MACSRASSTKSVASDDDTRQPTMRRGETADTEPAKNKPPPAQAHVAHQPRDGASGHANPVPSQLLPYLARPVHLLVLVPHALDRGAQLIVALAPLRSRRGLLLPGLVQEV